MAGVLRLVDQKGLEAMRKIKMDKFAESLAKEAKQFGAFQNSGTLAFLEENEEATGEFIVKLTVTVEKV